MLKLSKFYLKTYNLQNTAINIIIKGYYTEEAATLRYM